MYRAHIQHSTQQPVVHTYTRWREDSKHVWDDLKATTLSLQVSAHADGYLIIQQNNQDRGTVTIEQRDRSRTDVREQEEDQ